MLSPNFHISWNEVAPGMWNCNVRRKCVDATNIVFLMSGEVLMLLEIFVYCCFCLNISWSATELCLRPPSLWILVTGKIAWEIGETDVCCTRPLDVCRKPFCGLVPGFASWVFWSCWALQKYTVRWFPSWTYKRTAERFLLMILNWSGIWCTSDSET